MTLAPAARTPHDPRAPYADGKDCEGISRGLGFMTAAAPAARQMTRGKWLPSVSTCVMMRAEHRAASPTTRCVSPVPVWSK